MRIIGALLSALWVISAFAQGGQTAPGPAPTPGVVPSASSTEKRPPDFAMDYELPRQYSRPKSDWKERERAWFSRAIGSGPVDLVVVPFQVQYHALDRPTRSIMTAQLALAAAGTGKATVADPYLVSRALGDGERRIDSEAALNLANQLKAKRIVWGLVGHNRAGGMYLTIEYQDRAANGSFGPLQVALKKKIGEVAFSDENPAIEIFPSLLPEVLKSLGLQSAGVGKPNAVVRYDASNLPPAARPGAAAPVNLVREAYHLQLLGALTPETEERVRERLFEKSLLCLSRVSPDSSDYLSLKARAYMYLGLRPAAVQLLANAAAPEERALVAALNGNLPQLEDAASQIKTPLKRLFARLDVNEVRSAYGANSREKSLLEFEALRLSPTGWDFLVQRRLLDWSRWEMHDNLGAKKQLDLDFPVPGFTAESLVQGGVALGDREKVMLDVDFAVANHYQRVLQATPQGVCCPQFDYRVTAMDYLEVLTAVGTANLLKRAVHETQTLARPQQALALLDRFDAVYREHPAFVLARAQAQADLAAARQGAVRDGLLKAAYENVFNVLYWSQGQTRTASSAWRLLARLGRNDYGYHYSFYSADVPYRAHYPIWERGRDPRSIPAIGNGEAALKHSATDLQMLEQLIQLVKEPDRVDAIFKSLEGRFEGNPARAAILASVRIKQGQADSAKDHLRAAIQANPDNWMLYSQLGTMLVEGGDFSTAAKVLRDFPGFRGATGHNAVALSNFANEAGSLFYWRGEFELAIPFHRIAAELRTGSAASMTSEMRLALLESEFSRAAASAVDRARRYNVSYAYRDYLSLLHVLGYSKEAWSGFDVLSGQHNRPHVWSSALVGHRLAGLSGSEIIAWTKQDHLRKAGDGAFSFAARYLVLAGVTDRKPVKDLAAAVAALDRPVLRLQGPFRHTVRRNEATGRHPVLGPRATEGAILPIGLLENTDSTQVKSELVYFVEAYGAMREGDYASASRIFQEAATFYDFSQPRLGYQLSYFAYAAMRAGDADAVRSLLARFAPKDQGFDYHLAQGIMTALGGRQNEAIMEIRNAVARRVFMEDRPVYVEHQLAEICEWLYDATQQDRYRELALDWARKNQRFQPWEAWAYAMEAKLTKQTADRRRAVGMAVYLDRNSERLAGIPKAERDAAANDFARNNPFRNNADKQRGAAGI